ncbi:SRPBCC domain-containing protein [Acrocarpospora sp. B8E8]|uniref:SRPBCC domain-containing protein n=1 Tax=Acrocarpospora sp. B8E8 TaxID=3153572 RepID=UPI00325C8B25
MSTTQVYPVFIKASPEQVWKAITIPELTARYFHGARIENTAARHRSHGPDGAVWGDGPVFEYDPPHRLVHEWRSLFDEELAAEQPSRVTWEVEAREGGYCQLTLTHDRLEGAPKTAANVAGSGWMFVLSGLKTVLETGQSLAVDEPTSPQPGPEVGFALDTYQLVLLSRGARAGELDQARIDELGDEHIQHNLLLQAEGRLLAAGAVVGATATRNTGSDRPLIGLSPQVQSSRFNEYVHQTYA